MIVPQDLLPRLAVGICSLARRTFSQTAGLELCVWREGDLVRNDSRRSV